MKGWKPQLTAWAACCASALGQAEFPVAFVANNGNLEGSVSSFAISEVSAPVVIQKRIIGTRGSTSQNAPGANAISIDISPSGKYLVTGHASGSQIGEQITILAVASDGTMTLVLELPVPETSFSVLWLDEEYIAATQTIAFGVNELVVYRFDPQGPALTEVSRAYCGTFATKLVRHPTLRIIYVNDSGSANAIRSFAVAPMGELALLELVALGTYPLGIEIGPTGEFLYAAGGISGGGNKFAIFAVGPTGLLTNLPGSPFTSPGASPKEFSIDPTGSMLFVEHGTDATIRSFFLDSQTGVPTSTGQMFDIGLQGTLGATAAWRGILFATDESTALDGIRGLYALNVNFSTGTMTPINPVPVDSTGITPENIAIWDPPSICPADLNSDGELNFFDVQMFLTLFSSNDLAVDFNGDGELNFFDVQIYLGWFAAGCP